MSFTAKYPRGYSPPDDSPGLDFPVTKENLPTWRYWADGWNTSRPAAKAIQGLLDQIEKENGWNEDEIL